MNKSTFFAVLHLLWIVVGFILLPSVVCYPAARPPAILFVSITAVTWALTKGCILWRLQNKYNSTGMPSNSFVRHYLKQKFNLSLSSTLIQFTAYTWLSALLIICTRDASLPAALPIYLAFAFCLWRNYRQSKPFNEVFSR